MRYKVIFLLLLCFYTYSQEHRITPSKPCICDLIRLGLPIKDFKKFVLEKGEQDFEKKGILPTCQYKFNLCELLASRFSGTPSLLKKVFDAIEEVKPNLLKKEGVLERALCPWYPHICMKAQPSYASIEYLLSKNFDVNSDSLGATPLHFLLDFKAHNPQFPTEEFKKIFSLLVSKKARRKILIPQDSEYHLEDTLVLNPSDYQMQQIFNQNPVLARWITENY